MAQLRKAKRNRKFRGRATHGYGSKKKHRGRGSHGGGGWAGSFKHHKVRWKKSAPEHYSKPKFKSLEDRGMRARLPAITLRELGKLIGAAKDFDVAAAGFGKVIGAGSAPKATIKALAFSEGAKAAIEEAGGKAVLLGEAEEASEEK